MGTDPIEAKNEIFAERPRSDVRARYYKPAESDYRRRAQAQEKSPRTGFRERFVFQAIICGGFLALLLFFNIIDTNFTNNVTGWIEHNIAFDMLAEDGGIGGWVDNIVGFFGNEDTQNEPGAQYDVPPQFDIQAVPYAPITNTPSSSHIDENILREIDASVDVYLENNQ